MSKKPLQHAEHAPQFSHSKYLTSPHHASQHLPKLVSACLLLFVLSVLIHFLVCSYSGFRYETFCIYILQWKGQSISVHHFFHKWIFQFHGWHIFICNCLALFELLKHWKVSYQIRSRVFSALHTSLYCHNRIGPALHLYVGYTYSIA